GGSAASGQQRDEHSATVLVEVIARFVENEPGFTGQSGASEPDPGGLARGEAAQSPVEVAVLEPKPEIGHGCQGPFLDVPVIADEHEVGLVGVAAQGPLQSR